MKIPANDHGFAKAEQLERQARAKAEGQRTKPRTIAGLEVSLTAPPRGRTPAKSTAPSTVKEPTSPALTNGRALTVDQIRSLSRVDAEQRLAANKVAFVELSTEITRLIGRRTSLEFERSRIKARLVELGNEPLKPKEVEP